MNSSWKNDPRLKRMPPEKLQFLNEYAAKLSSTPKEQMMSVFLTLNRDAAARGIRFTDNETSLVISVLCSDMSPGEQKQLDLLQLLFKKMAVK